MDIQAQWRLTAGGPPTLIRTSSGGWAQIFSLTEQFLNLRGIPAVRALPGCEQFSVVAGESRAAVAEYCVGSNSGGDSSSVG
ncbi:hypothetical protein [Paraburkholderia tropica]|uniref:hypothetical protein n=1 Tax=Paraburkholderia tropica TaxID=92647 RepID=UPI002AB0BEAE|nr:hypothetical protein [Paraburkholderia tropica]